jgi:hypothetical protein
MVEVERGWTYSIKRELVELIGKAMSERCVGQIKRLMGLE